MAKRTPDRLEDIHQARDLDRWVVDKRVGKRANNDKARRRNRRYQRRILDHLAADWREGDEG
ncbi:MAG: hypothetical protein ACFCBW_13865 [Candidatus Competibacterales bacterium]